MGPVSGKHLLIPDNGGGPHIFPLVHPAVKFQTKPALSCHTPIVVVLLPDVRVNTVVRARGNGPLHLCLSDHSGSPPTWRTRTTITFSASRPHWTWDRHQHLPLGCLCSGSAPCFIGDWRIDLCRLTSNFTTILSHAGVVRVMLQKNELKSIP